jgi:hypothetical protein
MARYVVSEEEREILAARARVARDVFFQNALRDALAAGLEAGPDVVVVSRTSKRQ